MHGHMHNGGSTTLSFRRQLALEWSISSRRYLTYYYQLASVGLAQARRERATKILMLLAYCMLLLIHQNLCMPVHQANT